MTRRGVLGLLIAIVLIGSVVWVRARATRCRSPQPDVIDDPTQLDDVHLDLPDIEPTKWVRTYLPEKSSPGFNLILYRRRIPAVIDMDGSIVHAWPMVRAVGRARLSRDGHLAVIGIDNLIKEYDWGGRLTWYFQLPDAHHLPHHDLITMKNGNYLILGHDGHTHTDYLFEVDRERRVVWEWWMHEHRRSFPGWDRMSTDPSHCNSIRELPPNRWFDAGDERFRPGNILVSARNLNTIFIIDKVTGDVVWQWSKGLDHQHEAIMIERGMAGAGRIILFNNGLENLHAYRRSLVQIIDPIKEKVTWEYESEFFFSTVGGTAQTLLGNNIFITSSNGGRAFEITPDGRIVWEWVPTFNPMRVERLPYDHCPQLAAVAPVKDDGLRRQAPRPYVDTALYRFDYPFDTNNKVVDGKKRKLLKSNEGCRKLLIPPHASMKVGFGIDAGSLWGRSMTAGFRMTIEGENGVRSIVDESLASDAKSLWVRRTVPLGTYAYQHVELCIETTIEGGLSSVGEAVVWANPIIVSASQRPSLPPTKHRITKQERRLRKQQLKALGYVN
jgi:hypothetical protein